MLVFFPFPCSDDWTTLQDGFFAYSHRLRPGVNRDSHGIKVAQLADMPASALETANSVLAQLKNTSSTTSRQVLRELGRSALPSIPEPSS
jgi:DNA mismatch repair ATPase MutS